MKKDCSLLVCILDASGSMDIRCNEVIHSVNQAIKDRVASNSDELISIYQFSTEVQNVVNMKHVKEVSDFSYRCGGCTALRDAIGGVIDDVGAKLAQMSEDDRPEKVQVMILTDGEENSSRIYSPSKIKEMVEHQTTKYSWLFTYVGSNQDAILAGSKMGIDPLLCANYSDSNLSRTIGLASTKMMRAKGAEDYSSMVNMASYSLEERESLTSK